MVLRKWAFQQCRQLTSWRHTLDQLEQSSMNVSSQTYACVLRTCGQAKVLSDGKRIHAHIAQYGFQEDMFLGGVLVAMYCKCGALQDARSVFAKMHERDAFSWNVMINAYARQGLGSEALQLFHQMHQDKIVPNKFTFVSILSVCTCESTLVVGKYIHACIILNGFECDVVVGTALVDMYSKCGNVEAAQRVFDKMLTRNVVSWTAMISAHAQHGQGNIALQLFDLMQHEGEMGNKVTFVAVLDVCSGLRDLVEGVRLLARIVSSEIESDVVVGTALVTMFSKCSRLEDARKVFDNMPDRNVISWNAMIAAYAQHGKGKAAFELFHRMQQKQVEPNKATFVSILDACASLATLNEGEVLHAQIMRRRLESDIVVATALVNMYGKCGSLEKAQSLFERMPEKNVVSWNAMIAIHVQHGHNKEALNLFHQMHCEGILSGKVTFVSMLDACARVMALAGGKQLHALIESRGFQSDAIVGTSLINMYAKCGDLEEARRIFDEIMERNVITWSAMIAAYAQHGEGKEAFHLFDRMCKENVKPDMATFVSVLDACASLATLAEGEQLHAKIVVSGFESDVFVASALVNMYGKCGYLAAAQVVFDRMHVRNIVTWNTMIATYAQHGQGREALTLFSKMQGERVRPNETTFVSVLSACSHAGLVVEGHNCFLSMREDRGITVSVDHYLCMIDLVGRAGLLEEAEDLIQNMPYQPSVVSWITLLGACRYHQLDVQRGEHAANRVFNLEPENVAAHVMLSNIYAVVGTRSGSKDNVHDEGKRFTKVSEYKFLEMFGPPALS